MKPVAWVVATALIMRRITVQPRPQWEQRVESQGLSFHSPDGHAYWTEGAYYHFTRSQIDTLEAATYDLDRMCLAAVDHVIKGRAFDRFQIPPPFIDYIVRSWAEDEVSVYGRFDLAYDGRRTPKLLEYNADTPTSLLEAAVIQWFWFKDVFPEVGIATVDQFNSIHERLIDAWKRWDAFTRPALPANEPSDIVYFSTLADPVEDLITVTYLRDTAIQAGLTTESIDVESIGWNWGRRLFVDLQERPIRRAFKLYPWEWMTQEAFAPQLLERTTRWLEPPWKMLLSNKAILPVLYELFPESPYLLKASFEPMDGPHVRKPIFGREGANIQRVIGGKVAQETGGPHSQGPFVYQELFLLPEQDGYFPVIGSWMIDGTAAGIGIREDRSPITGNASRFVPHVFNK